MEGVCVRSAGSDSGECREQGIDKGVSGKKALYTHGSFCNRWILGESEFCLKIC